MKRINFIVLALIGAAFFASDFPGHAAPAPEPQYSSTDDTAGRTYTGYFIEDGQLKNTMIVVKRRRLVSYWNGTAWIECIGKVEKSDLSQNQPEDAPDALKFLAKFPKCVKIQDHRVYFDPQEN